MSSSYSSNLRVELIGSGDQAGTWGTTTNNNFAYLLDTAIAGAISVTISTTPQALTAIQGPTATLASNQAVYATLKLESAASAFTLYAPPAAKQYIVWNATSYTATIGNATALGGTTSTGGTTITLTAGEKALIWSDNTNFYKTTVDLSGAFGTLPIANGGTGQITANAAFNALAPAQTANRVLKSNGTNTSFAQVALTTDVTGTLPVANGGTGVTGSTGSGSVVLSTSPTLVTPILGTPQSGTLSSCTGLPLTTGVTGTLPVGNGGTGATTLSSGALLKGAGTSAVTTASAADIVGQIGATAVTNATNATNLVTANFSIVQASGKLYFKYGGTNIASLDSSGNFTTLADVASYDTP